MDGTPSSNNTSPPPLAVSNTIPPISTPVRVTLVLFPTPTPETLNRFLFNIDAAVPEYPSKYTSALSWKKWVAEVVNTVDVPAVKPEVVLTDIRPNISAGVPIEELKSETRSKSTLAAGVPSATAADTISSSSNVTSTEAEVVISTEARTGRWILSGSIIVKSVVCRTCWSNTAPEFSFKR